MKTLLLTSAILLMTSLAVSPAMAVDATSFFTPAFATSGLAGYHEFDVFANSTGNTADVGSSHSGATVSTVYPGYVSGSQNFYSHASAYNVSAVIPAVPGGTPSMGTTVIVQTASTLGEADATMSGLQIFDDADALLTDTPFNEELLFFGVVSSSYGPVTQKETAYAFWLADYVGDFKLSWSNPQHSSFKALRVDTMMGNSVASLSSVPEPSTAALCGIAMVGLGTCLRRRRNR